MTKERGTKPKLSPQEEMREGIQNLLAAVPDEELEGRAKAADVTGDELGRAKRFKGGMSYQQIADQDCTHHSNVIKSLKRFRAKLGVYNAVQAAKRKK